MRKTILILLFIMSWLIASCSLRPGAPPEIEISSPSSGVKVRLGERVLMQSTARDDRAIVKTELWVDGRLYRVDQPTQSTDEKSFAVIQIWDASSVGTHTLMVKAHDEDGQVSVPASVVIEVLPPLPTPTPAPTSAPTVAVDAGCTPSARFVEDVTVPDDSLFNSGVKFTKTWRVRNDGTCMWEAGTKWVFISGSSMNAAPEVEVELAEPERIIDISVDMVAPDAPGTYRGYWRLCRPNGDFFGDQAYVRIIVP